jgi:hypothetical protein
VTYNFYFFVVDADATFEFSEHKTRLKKTRKAKMATTNCDVCNRDSTMECTRCMLRKYCSDSCAHEDWEAVHSRYCDQIINIMQMEFHGIHEQKRGMPAQVEQEYYRDVLLNDILQKQSVDAERAYQNRH